VTATLPRALLIATLAACHLGNDRVEHAAEPDANYDHTNDPKYRIFASYFNLLKRKVSDAWHPNEVLQLVDPRGTIYGHANRVTEVRVCLSRDGSIVAVLVTSSSSIPELDAEALRAFRIAAPFAAVPATLVDGLGHMSFAFTFYFQLDAKGLRLRTKT
jgi:TonB family protein